MGEWEGPSWVSGRGHHGEWEGPSWVSGRGHHVDAG
jgi:hypothetical protein